MNRTFDNTIDRIAAHAVSELDLTTGRVIDRTRRTSNDAPQSAPISAVDAMALCMAVPTSADNATAPAEFENVAVARV